MSIRSTAFWTLDRLRTSPLATELADVRQFNVRGPHATDLRRRRLDDHLRFVASDVDFFREFRGTTELSDFPVTSKATILENPESTIAVGVDRDKCHQVSTSGSSGVPLRLLHDSGKRFRNSAESIYLLSLAGYEIGDPFWYLETWSSRTRQGFLRRMARNVRQVDVSSFTEDEARSLLGELSRNRHGNALYAFSSVLETIAKLIQKEGLDRSELPKVTSMVGTSDPFGQEARQILADAFGVVPLSQYGMEELGLIAQQTALSDPSHKLNMASHVVEILRIDADEPAAPGEIGRIVITDFVNRAQPLIRYDTGDLAAAGESEPGTGFASTLTRFEGRSRDRLYDVNDQPLASLIDYTFWWKYPELRQYQIVQRGRGDYLLNLDVDQPFTGEAALIADLREQVGSAALIEVEYGDTDYQHPSGKRRPIISQYTPGEPD